MDIHSSLSYEKFSLLMQTNKYNQIDFKIKKNHNNLFEFLFRQHSSFDKGNIIEEVRKYTTDKLLLIDKEISRIKCKAIGRLKNLSLIDIIEKIKCTDFNLEIISEDISIFYLFVPPAMKMIFFSGGAQLDF